jgi:hypothetical protein
MHPSHISRPQRRMPPADNPVCRSNAENHATHRTANDDATQKKNNKHTRVFYKLLPMRSCACSSISSLLSLLFPFPLLLTSLGGLLAPSLPTILFFSPNPLTSFSTSLKPSSSCTTRQHIFYHSMKEGGRKLTVVILASMIRLIRLFSSSLPASSFALTRAAISIWLLKLAGYPPKPPP